MDNQNDSNILIGIIIGMFATIGIISGIYFKYKYNKKFTKLDIKRLDEE